MASLHRFQGKNLKRGTAMATLVLTTVGSVIGGPVGGAIGAIIGQQVDQRLFAQKGREGPRLTDLSVQTSRYGSAIPKLFGKVRVSGTVIWSTDLIETRGQQSNGKGRPKTTVYSYSASFAVALSARAVGRIGRIWADGNLLRGAAGDFKSPCVFRLLSGGEDQAVDPLIAAAEGIATTPAYRGCAIAVFEDLQLADFGNRIPSLSFEVFADEGPLSVAKLLNETTAGAIAGESEALIDGMAVQGSNARGVATSIAAALPFSLRDNGVILTVAGAGTPNPIVAEALGASAATPTARTSDHRVSTATIPGILSIAYYDSERDFQPGVQRARREGGSHRDDRIDFAATLGASTAKAVVEARLTGVWRERRRLVVALPWSSLDLKPGDCVAMPGDPTHWRIAAMSFERMVMHLDLKPFVADAFLERSAESGRNTAQIDAQHGPTTLVVLDLPPLNDVAASVPQVVVAANGSAAGWRRAPLLVSSDGGTSFTPMGGTAVPATIGRTVDVLGVGSAFLIDRFNTVDVVLLNAASALSDADSAALLTGANIAMIGRECIQFERARAMGNGRWCLSGLWRGRRGTENAIADHAANEPFVLIEPDALALVPAVHTVSGTAILPTGVGDMAAVPSTIVSVGAATTPLSPVNPTTVRQLNGDITVSWIRRSREGWRWDDAIDAPLGEAVELYRIARAGSGLSPMISEAAEPQWIYPAAQIAADRNAGATSVTLSIRQVGTRGISLPAELTIAL
jgi:hypothetical protein